MKHEKNLNLEARLSKLEDIELIRRLKYNYAWFLDQKMWKEYKNILADGMIYTGHGREFLKDEFVNFVSKGLENLVTSHQLHQSLIDITSAKTARAVWCLRDDISNPEKGTKFKGRAYYTENYVKIENEWKIMKIALRYLCTEGSAVVLGSDTGLRSLVI